jgi:predicted Fe-Mo cluster-binding NifX family protein
MKIALAIEADKMTLAKNGGHAPRFAVYELNGQNAGLLEIRENPRNGLPQNCKHDHTDSHSDHEHHHHDDDTEEMHQLRSLKKKEMAQNLSDCAVVYTHFACPGTRKAFSEFGIKVEAFTMAGLSAEEVLRNLQMQQG